MAEGGVAMTNRVLRFRLVLALQSASAVLSAGCGVLAIIFVMAGENSFPLAWVGWLAGLAVLFAIVSVAAESIGLAAPPKQSPPEKVLPNLR